MAKKTIVRTKYPLEDNVKRMVFIRPGGGGGGEFTIPWATRAETDAGVLTDKALNPDVGAYAYDRLRHPGQHTAGKGTKVYPLVIDSGTVTIDSRKSDVFDLTLTDDVAFANPVNPINGQTINILLKQDEFGSRLATFGNQWTFVNRIDPVLSTDPGAVDMLSCQWDPSSAKMRCSFIPDFGTGYVTPPDYTLGDFSFVSLGGGNEVVIGKDLYLPEIYFRTIVGEGDVEVTTVDDTIVISYTTPETVDVTGVSFLTHSSVEDFPGLPEARMLQAGSNLLIDNFTTDGIVEISCVDPGVPPGGTTGQTLRKITDDDYDFDWADSPEGGVSALGDLDDVSVATAVDGDALIYDAAYGTWVPGASSSVAALDDLTDVNTAGVVDGDALIYDAAYGTWGPGVVAASLLRFSANARFDYYNDFIGTDHATDDGWVTSTSSGGTVTQPASSAGHPGAILLQTSTSTSGYGLTALAPIGGSAFSAEEMFFMPTGADEVNLEICFKVNALFSASNPGQYRLGFIDELSTYANRAYLELGTSNIVVNTRGGGSASTTDVSAAISAATWHVLKVQLTATAVRYWIDGVLQDTHTTNLPAAGMTVAMLAQNSGATGINHALTVDYAHVWGTTDRDSAASEEPGSIFALDDLTDVNTAGVADGDALVYDFATNTWVPGASSSVGALNDLSDVDTTGVGDGDALVYDAAYGTWVPMAGGAGVAALNDLTDVTVASPAEAEILTYDGSGWVNAAPASADPQDIPISRSPTTSFTLALTDRGCAINFTPTASGTITIPANASIAFPVGSVVVVHNRSSYQQTIDITSDTLEMVCSGLTGSRVLYRYGTAVLHKIATTTWRLMGANIA